MQIGPFVRYLHFTMHYATETVGDAGCVLGYPRRVTSARVGDLELGGNKSKTYLTSMASMGPIEFYRRAFSFLAC